MKPVYVAAAHLLSPLGDGAYLNYEAVLNGQTGVQVQEDGFCVARFPDSFWEHSLNFDPLPNQLPWTRFERLALHSIQQLVQQTGISLSHPRTLLLLSTTKGNIEVLHTPSQDALIDLQKTAIRIGRYFNSYQRPQVLSNACISGLLAMIVGRRLLQTGAYDHILICGADLATDFVLSGFKSFQAVSDQLCKPFDIDRKGINLGEGVASILLTTNSAHMQTDLSIQLGMGASRNDANHISGPSRTGAELADALNQAMQASGLQATDMSFVSAHGTATLYNDEMESKAFHLAGLAQTPVHSLKGNFGHTLGAAGLIESIIGMYALKYQTILPTKGFENLGVPMPLHIQTEASPMQGTHFVKTTSGFGGCNAALVFSLY